MSLFAIPLMITVPAWLTWRELSLIIFNQAKRFIDFVKYILNCFYQNLLELHIKKN